MEKRILDWNKYCETSARAVSEGIVMLKNDGALPLNKQDEIAVFGRIQLHYYKSGTGSGGMVNVSHVVSIPEGLRDAGIKLNEALYNAYDEWDSSHPFNYGEGWGTEPWCQEEMPLTEELVMSAASTSKTAVVIIGRTAGEEMDNKEKAGSFLLTELEEDMLRKVRAHFDKMIVLLNVPALFDMGFMDRYTPEAVLYVWQGGMVGGTGTAMVLTGEVSPCGKLPDTIAYNISDYPSSPYFGEDKRDFYAEDIYVGYRYFETFAKDKVRYPFGFGLSYTTFRIKNDNFTCNRDGLTVTLGINVKNTGSVSGKEVVQVYLGAPQGKLGKPARVLCGYAKTKTLSPNEEQQLEITVDLRDFASYDDSGVTGHRFCRILEAGEYDFYVGSDVRSAKSVWSKRLSEDVVVEQLIQALAPVLPFKRMKNDNGTLVFEDVPLSMQEEFDRRAAALPEEIPQTGDRGLKLSDVVNGSCTMREFIAQLSDEDLSCIIRGEGMGSPKVTPGTASAFGGVSDGLKKFGIPCGCCSDGPSGMRMDCGTKAFSLPGGTLLAATFNRELITELFVLMGLEMTANNVDCLLGPGMNIHRHPLNGRNFEYFSEDPYLTGTIACAELDGLHSVGVTGTIKHFCGNNRETHRHWLDSVVSERALREIYLRGFEIAIKQGKAATVMTTYGSVNGVWTAGSYDLNTTILREQWGFTGFTMTDWWANINRRGQQPDKRDFAIMAMAQNDVYMVCADGGNHDDNTLDSLASGELKRAELQRNAANILGFLITTHAMKREMGISDAAEIINRPAENNGDDGEVPYYPVQDEITLDLDGMMSKKGENYCFALDFAREGRYRVTITASSELSELAQTAVTLFSVGSACGSYIWNGTGGEPVALSKEINVFSRFTSIRLHFAANGLKLHSIKYERIGDPVV
ncbi:MAG: beta-glucosidase [Ruminococcaceae bacterium]|nr:beta-glucosidase [Oscillospiraceae bacterium]